MEKLNSPSGFQLLLH